MLEIVVITPTLRSDCLLKRACLSVKKNSSKNLRIKHLVIFDNVEVQQVDISDNDYYNLTLLQNLGCKGPSPTRNIGLNKISNHVKYFVFLDSDDYLSDNYIKNVLNKISHTDATIAFGQGVLSDGMSNFQNYSNVPIGEGLVNRLLISSNIIGCPSGVIVKNCMGNRSVLFDTELRYLEDFLYYLNLRELGNIFLKTNEHYYYQVHENQSTNKKNLHQFKSQLSILSEKTKCLKVSWLEHFLIRERLILSSFRFVNRSYLRSLISIIVIGLICPRWALGRAKMRLGL